MAFTPAEADVFWPVYDKFQEKLFLNRIALVKLIGQFASSYEGLTDEEALNLDIGFSGKAVKHYILDIGQIDVISVTVPGKIPPLLNYGSKNPRHPLP